MEDITKKLYKDIKETYQKEINSNANIKSLLSKINKGEADYSDMLKYSKELGKCVEKAFQVNISDDVLPDGKMYYDMAKSLLEPMCKENYKTIAAHCVAVQTRLNQQANIGLKGIKPSYKENKTEGIIKYISEANKYSEREKSFLQSLSTNLKSIVDDSVKENAEFHYKSGLSPKIIRRTTGKSCKWCQSLSGIYNYSMLDSTDVFRRHANCDCIVIYDPSDGSKKVQDVWSKKWNDQSKYDVVSKRLKKIENKIKLPDGIEDVTKIYLSKATPSKGKLIFDEGILEGDKEITKWLYKTFGGDIQTLKDVNEDHVKTPDAFWNGKYWEYKNPKTKNAIDKRIKKAVSQLGSKEGGIVLDLTGSELTHQESIKTIVERLPKRLKNNTDIIIKDKDSLLITLRYTKKK